MTSLRRQHVWTLLGLLIAGLALPGAGALHARQAYLTRGIPAGLPEPIPHGGARLGLNVSLAQYDDAQLAANLAQIRALGIDALKQSFHYHADFDWDASDRLVTAVAAHNLTLIPLLDGHPADNFAPPADPAGFAAWAGAFAARYGDRLTHYVIWDEPNLTSHWGLQPVNPYEYAALLTAAAAAIRAADGDAVIVAAPLAPTVETGPQNLADHLYLQRLFEAGAGNAFDVATGKPYGFDSGPEERRVDGGALNFSRAILLREVLLRNGAADKALWAGNWGWNSLPEGWTGRPSIWGAVTAAQQATWTAAALARAQREWPWMGLMFLENWEPQAAPDDPRWGFSLARRPELQARLQEAQPRPGVALPGFHPARPDDPAQVYAGGWRFAPQFGADISQTLEGAEPDRVTFTFWGTDVGLRVRRADFRARLYVTVDGRPANALPRDEHGTMLVLTAPDPAEDYVVTVPVARNLDPGVHTLTVVAARGWDQWALNGFSVGYRPPAGGYRLGLAALLATAVGGLALAVYHGRRAGWGALGRRVQAAYNRWRDGTQLAITAVAALLVALMGWLTWGTAVAGVYRRLGDAGQLALTAAAAGVFYVAPSFIVYAAALILLFVLIALRPAWGLALVAFCFPFYVPPALKPVFSYRFSPVEVFTLVTVTAVAGAQILNWARRQARPGPLPARALVPHGADLAVLLFVGAATLSLLFTARLDVATNEWRLVILEPALFYLALRLARPSARELWTMLDAFVLGGLVVAGYGLLQYLFVPESLITAEGGLLRLRSIFGSPNNVALYLGRIVPLLAAVALLGNGRRRWLYAAALAPILLAFLLTFSRGGLLLGLPAGLLFVFWRRQAARGHKTWPWALLVGALGAAAFLAAQQIPQLAGRLDLAGATGVFRLNLWRASLEMIREHPLWGVGPDNFLYAYRGRYILDAAWQEPDLNHPHNLVLDFATRLGLLGLLAGGWLIAQLARALRRAARAVDGEWRPVVVGLGGALAAMLAHGLVDHSFFLVDLAFVFYLLLGTAVILEQPWKISGAEQQTENE
jgi:O-antigen ligase